MNQRFPLRVCILLRIERAEAGQHGYKGRGCKRTGAGDLKSAAGNCTFMLEGPLGPRQAGNPPASAHGKRREAKPTLEELPQGAD